MDDWTQVTPSLDLLRGFEAAARHLNFTRAASELFVTQSAVSRQIKTLEERLSVTLFVRQAKGLRLTEEGEELYRAVSGALRQMSDAMERLGRRNQAAPVTVTSTLGFCSLWLIPRLGLFHKTHPEVEVRIAANDRVLNLDRERIDISVRYCTSSIAPKGSAWLFAEELVPVCSPALLDLPGRPLRTPADLTHHVLLHLDDPDNPAPWVSWRLWMDAVGITSVRPAGSLTFNYFDQTIRAALAGQGVALGRTVLVQDFLQDGSLVAPFPQRIGTERGYWLFLSSHARGRPEVKHFADWIVHTARTAPAEGAGAVQSPPPDAPSSPKSKLTRKAAT